VPLANVTTKARGLGEVFDDGGFDDARHYITLAAQARGYAAMSSEMAVSVVTVYVPAAFVAASPVLRVMQPR